MLKHLLVELGDSPTSVKYVVMLHIFVDVEAIFADYDNKAKQTPP